MKSTILFIVIPFISGCNAASCFSAGYKANDCVEPQGWSWTCGPSDADPHMARGPPDNNCEWKVTLGPYLKSYCCEYDGEFTID
ncbi:unnamed protein product [Cercospora beticola]|nr:unnamed protein product [Cercospora beticola]